MSALRIAVHGATGRMGRRVIALAGADEDFELAAALECADHPQLGADAGTLAGIGPLGVPLAATLDQQVDAVIDFSIPAAVGGIAEHCRDRRTALVVATTGLSDQQQRALRTTADSVPVVHAANMSLAVNLLMKLTQVAAQALKDYPSGVDVEIIERHHRFKADAPSGTALEFGKIVRSVMGQTRASHGRHGQPGPRRSDEIGYHAVRVGDDPGQHTIVFGLLGETIELSVAASNRDCYARGALAAARFVAGKPPGLYNMADVLGLGCQS